MPSIFLSLQLLVHVLLSATAQFSDVLVLSFFLLLFSSSPLPVAAVCSPVVVFSSFPYFFVLPPSVPCIYCMRLVQCARLTKAGVIDMLVKRLP